MEKEKWEILIIHVTQNKCLGALFNFQSCPQTPSKIVSIDFFLSFGFLFVVLISHFLDHARSIG